MPIGAWVIREASAEAISWPDHVRVAVNVSAVQFHRGPLTKPSFTRLPKVDFRQPLSVAARRLPPRRPRSTPWSTRPGRGPSPRCSGFRRAASPTPRARCAEIICRPWCCWRGRAGPGSIPVAHHQLFDHRLAHLSDHRDGIRFWCTRRSGRRGRARRSRWRKSGPSAIRCGSRPRRRAPGSTRRAPRCWRRRSSSPRRASGAIPPRAATRPEWDSILELSDAELNYVNAELQSVQSTLSLAQARAELDHALGRL